MPMNSKETVYIFGDPTDPVIQECAARIVAAGRKVVITTEDPPPYRIPLDDFTIIEVPVVPDPKSHKSNR